MSKLLQPIVATAVLVCVLGTACPGCIVELFSDEEDEGRVYEGYTIADVNGNWMWEGSPNGPNVTATATESDGSTSGFSAPQKVWRRWVYLPVTLNGR